ncbi:MAG: ornithine cyclodeaminase family protein [Sulfolobales archaeon]
MLFLREEEVSKIISFKEAIEAIERIHLDQALGRAKNLPRRRIYGGGYVLHTMSASAESLDIAGLKTYLSTPMRTVFVILLYSISKSELIAVIEADILGRIRTGAASAIASKYLARRNSSVIGVVGSGRQAFTQALALSEVFTPNNVIIYSKEKANAERICSELIRKGFKCSIQDTLKTIFEKSDIISTATNSRDPFVSKDLIKRGVHLNLIGSNNPQRSEAYPEIFEEIDLVVTDDKEQAKMESGDLIRAVENKYLTWDNVYELWQVVSKYISRSSDDQVTLFKSHGIALWDIAVAYVVYKKAIKLGIGLEIDFKGFWQHRYF